MQQFVVPQFIDNEDKILGPITVRQFIILLTAVLLLAILYRFLSFTGFVLAVLFVGGFSIVLAFVKVNGRGFHYYILNIIQIAIRPGIRVWRLDKVVSASKKKKKDKTDITPPTKLVKPRDVRQSHLSELSLLVDTGGRYRPDQRV
ncbi:MAG: PrgI family protein [Patescibacteria group bacterium]